MATQSRAIIQEVANVCWYMRGGLSWTEAWNLSPREKEAINKTIKDNIENTEKSGLALL